MAHREVALMLQGSKAKLRMVIVVIISLCIGIAALYGLLKPVSNGCIMTYMYPTYIPISSMGSAKYALYLYHEGWKKIDYKEHLKKLNGVPVLFIPGNGGSYKQVRSLAAESDRAYQGGPLERTFYQEAFLTTEEGGADMDLACFQLPSQYNYRLDWFAVDLEGEHSAMDGRILEEHTEYVVYAIHRILDQYKESHDAREREGAAVSGNLPKSVILVGHSMGGFVARAAASHPSLRKSAVETILTLSTPHQSPPVALQPSLGHYFTQINEEWREGYQVQTTQAGRFVSDPPLSHIVVISISGGYYDYQVRSKLESLDGIVPPTHGFMISSTGMKNVWLSMEHQAILWCNQLVVQVSHTVLSLINSRTGQPFSDTRKRLAIFTRMLHSGLPQSFNWKMQPQLFPRLTVSTENANNAAGSQACPLSNCPTYWTDDALERDLYIQTTTVTVLAMDGRRRWLDIQKLGSNGKSHFIFVTNLAPCSGVRLHLWPEKGKSTSDLPASRRVLEVTSKMVLIPSGPAPRQIEPGSQTEQAPPSAVLMLGPDDMHGFRFLTISVAPRPTISGRPPPATSMAVGQFFNPEEGQKEYSPQWMLLSAYSHKEMFLKEDHPLAFNLSFAISLGLLPVTLSLETAGCGIKKSGLPDEDGEHLDNSKIHVLISTMPPLNSEHENVMLLVDPHCSYKISFSVSVTAAASRFLLLYGPQMVALSVAVLFFSLTRQAYEWDSNLVIPSLLAAVEFNLRMPFPFLLLAIVPILASFFLSLLKSQPSPPMTSFITVSLLCYLFANGFIILLTLVSQLVFYLAAVVHTSIKARWQAWGRNFSFSCPRLVIKLSSIFFSLKVIRILRVNTVLITAAVAISLVCFVHPALGLFVLVLSHAFCCHNSMSSFLMASRRKEFFYDKYEANDKSQRSAPKNEGTLDQDFPPEEKPPSLPGSPKKCFGETQIEIFHHRHGLLVLHLVATLMFAPSLVAWLQRIGMRQSFPWFLDSALCIGVIFHCIFNLKPESSFLFYFPPILSLEVRPQFIYMLAGYYSYFSGLDLAPYRVFYAMAAIGFISFVSKLLQIKKTEQGDQRFRIRKHSHRH
ncbi:GPI inositol-deacylase [Carica papaya]|uniref:GPI inositol-deacylase n=1 Tax=Carica papaya TaxID=3649 RepID=UPI000B8CE71F|nr:GPI inositol-deacylase [Carica papaya]